MGLRSVIILIAAVLTVIIAIFQGDSTSFMQGLGVLVIFGIIGLVGKFINGA